MGKVAWIIFGSVIVVVFGGLIIYSRSANPPIDVSNVDTNTVIAASEQNGNIADHTFGNTDSKVTLIEYGDFQCPSCGGAHPQIKSITEDYKDKVAFIYRNFPLTSLHPNAKAAASAVEAAGLQGKYWDMHNLIFESQSEWGTLSGTARTDQFVSYASQLGLDQAKFTTDLAASGVTKKINFDLALGKKLGVNATPTFYLNGEKLSDEVSSALVQGSTSELTKLIDQKLEN